MFDGTNHGERLAWICLLCYVKAQGRAGKVRLRGKVFALQFRLTAQAIDGMISRAKEHGAITVQDEQIVVVNWKEYQDPRVRSPQVTSTTHVKKTHRRFSKSSENDATHHPSPLTTIPPKPPKDRKIPTLEEVKAYFAEKKTTIDPEEFWAHYESNGWVQGNRGKPIQKWKMCLVKWEKEERKHRGEYQQELLTPEEEANYRG